MQKEISVPTTGSIIKSFRNNLGLSQEGLAKYLKIPRELVSNYETNSRSVPLKQMHQLANLFGIDLIDLVSPSENTVQVNVAFAFRANSLTEKNLESIASFRKIVKNYMKIKAKSKEIKEK